MKQMGRAAPQFPTRWNLCPIMAVLGASFQIHWSQVRTGRFCVSSVNMRHSDQRTFAYESSLCLSFTFRWAQALWTVLGLDYAKPRCDWDIISRAEYEMYYPEINDCLVLMTPHDQYQRTPKSRYRCLLQEQFRTRNLSVATIEVHTWRSWLVGQDQRIVVDAHFCFVNESKDNPNKLHPPSSWDPWSGYVCCVGCGENGFPPSQGRQDTCDGLSRACSCQYRGSGAYSPGWWMGIRLRSRRWLHLCDVD